MPDKDIHKPCPHELSVAEKQTVHCTCVNIWVRTVGMEGVMTG